MSIEIELLPAAVTDDPRLVEQVADLTNRVYAVAEDGLWREDATRTTAEEVAGLIRAREIAVARVHGEIVGSVRVQRLDARTGEVGMLAVDAAHRGIGVGRELLQFAERTCASWGLRTMQLELLVPRNWTHPMKEFLDAWYTRVGYRVARTGTLDEAYPNLLPLLATPCDFVIYRKPLAVEANSTRAGPSFSLGSALSIPSP